MILSDFHIGLEFVASAGFRWRCTDVGTRTILAIRLDRKDPNWYQGPPYIAKEVVFDEHKMACCHLTNADAVSAAMKEHQTMTHPGYPSEVVTRMLEARHAQPYPHSGVLRFRPMSAGRGNPPSLRRAAGGRGVGRRAIPAVPGGLRGHARTGLHRVATGDGRQPTGSRGDQEKRLTHCRKSGISILVIKIARISAQSLIGKGGVEGDVPVSDALMADFARYRAFHGLPTLPASDNRRPLILGIAGRQVPLTAAAVYLVVKDALGRVAEALAPSDPARATRLRRASTHWLRHTAATHQAEDGTPIHHIQQNLRHSSIATTSIYLHAEEDARHASTTRTRTSLHP